MTAQLESPQLTCDAAPQILATILADIARHDAPLTIDGRDPGEILSYLVQEEIAAILQVAADTPYRDDELLSAGAGIARLCCDFTAKAMFIAMNEPPQQAIATVSDLLQELRTDLGHLAEAFVVPSASNG